MIKMVTLAFLIIWVCVLLVFARSAYRDSKRDEAKCRERDAMIKQLTGNLGVPAETAVGNPTGQMPDTAVTEHSITEAIGLKTGRQRSPEVEIDIACDPAGGAS